MGAEEQAVYMIPGGVRVELASDYCVGVELGAGGYGVVRACRERRTGEVVACKTIWKHRIRAEGEQAAVLREIATMRHVAGHGGVVELKGVYEDSEAVHILMEVADGGDLLEWLNNNNSPMHEDVAREVFRQVVEAVAYCHRNGVLHRDLKPENILLFSGAATGKEKASSSSENSCEEEKCFPFSKHRVEEVLEQSAGGREPNGGAGVKNRMRVKLADFGLAVMSNGERGELVAEGRAGSPSYLAPEVAEGRKYGAKADIWSLGVLLHILISRQHPFHSREDEGETSKLVYSEVLDLSMGIWSRCSSELKELVQWMLTIESENRPSADEVLKHTWLREKSGRSSSVSSLSVGRFDLPNSRMGEELSFSAWCPVQTEHSLGEGACLRLISQQGDSDKENRSNNLQKNKEEGESVAAPGCSMNERVCGDGRVKNCIDSCSPAAPLVVEAVECNDCPPVRGSQEAGDAEEKNEEVCAQLLESCQSAEELRMSGWKRGEAGSAKGYEGLSRLELVEMVNSCCSNPLSNRQRVVDEGCEVSLDNYAANSTACIDRCPPLKRRRIVTLQAGAGAFEVDVCG